MFLPQKTVLFFPIREKLSLSESLSLKDVEPEKWLFAGRGFHTFMCEGQARSCGLISKPSQADGILV
jgi:hypothetical protein